MGIPAKFNSIHFDYSRAETWRARLSRWMPTFFEAKVRTEGPSPSEMLASELQTLLQERLSRANDPMAELQCVILELGAVGHPLELDEDDPDQKWTIYADKPHRNLALWVHWTEHKQVVSAVEVLWQKM